MHFFLLLFINHSDSQEFLKFFLLDIEKPNFILLLQISLTRFLLLASTKFYILFYLLSLCFLVPVTSSLIIYNLWCCFLIHFSNFIFPLYNVIALFVFWYFFNPSCKPLLGDIHEFPLAFLNIKYFLFKDLFCLR